MEPKKSGKSAKRHILCEMSNTDAPKTSHSRGKVKFSGFPNIEKLIYHDDEESTQDNVGFENQKTQKETCPEISEISKETVIQIKDMQGEQKLELEENHGSTPHLHVIGSSFMKEKKLFNSIEECNIQIKAKETSNEKREIKILKGHSKSNSNENLPPGLTKLICKSKVDKITRPPNAFMLFAKEHRHKVREDNPEETNRKISIILGNMWRTLSDEDKSKYYHNANAVEKLHKQKYPDYVYSPSEARLQKQSRIIRRLKQKESPIVRNIFESVKNDGSTNRSNFIFSDRTNNQKASFESPVENSNSSANKLCKNDGHGATKGCLNSSKSQLNSPVYWPYVSKWKPAFDSPTPFIGISPSFCNCQVQGTSQTARSPLSAPQHPSFKMDYPCPPMKFNNPYPAYPSPMFHPAVWNPWLMFPGSCYPMSSTPHVEEFYKDWMERHAHLPPYFEKIWTQQSQQNIPNAQETKGKVKDSAETNESDTAAASDDDSSHSLVIVEDSGDEFEKGNLMNIKESVNENR